MKDLKLIASDFAYAFAGFAIGTLSAIVVGVLLWVLAVSVYFFGYVVVHGTTP